jgi:hypothetical protein
VERGLLFRSVGPEESREKSGPPKNMDRHVNVSPSYAPSFASNSATFRVFGCALARAWRLGMLRNHFGRMYLAEAWQVAFS